MGKKFYDIFQLTTLFPYTIYIKYFFHSYHYYVIFIHIYKIRISKCIIFSFFFKAGYVRFIFAIMLCIANIIIYGLKVNISTTIIGMVKTKYTNKNDVSHECPAFLNSTSSSSSSTDLEGPYDWSTTEQGLVVSLYFAGYMLGMFPAGYFSDRFVYLPTIHQYLENFLTIKIIV